VRRAAILLALGLAVAPARGADEARPPLLDLRDGDRVVFLGDAFTERGQAFGYLETMLTVARPHANVEYRNLGWSGDTVFGEARAGFGTAEDGFKHLREHVAAIKPTVLIIGYGANESFAGETGLPAFRSGYARLLDALQAGKPRQIILLSPIPAENLGLPLPDPAAHNRDLASYRDAIRAIADERKLGFVDLFGLLNEVKPAPKPVRHVYTESITDDGIHPTAVGYRFIDELLTAKLGMGSVGWKAKIGSGGTLVSASGIKIEAIEKLDSGFRFRALDERLAGPRFPDATNERREDPTLTIRVLPPGQYVLKIDGSPVATRDADNWAVGVSITRGPSIDQVEALRKAIVAKNQLYFYRWRPQNETYLFGFRKHEQGQNGREIPQFDPLVAAKEAEIARLRVPVAHTYELVREGN